MTQERLNQCNVRLLRDEIDVIAIWHRDRETEYARVSEYRNAEFHKNRADELFRISDWLIRRSEAAA